MRRSANQGCERVRADDQLVSNEAHRLATLREYGILDTLPENCFDHLVRTAAALLAAPIGLISLVDERRVWFKARMGLETTEMPRAGWFCTEALLTGGAAMVVPN